MAPWRSLCVTRERGNLDNEREKEGRFKGERRGGKGSRGAPADFSDGRRVREDREEAARATMRWGARGCGSSWLVQWMDGSGRDELGRSRPSDLDLTVQI